MLKINLMQWILEIYLIYDFCIQINGRRAAGKIEKGASTFFSLPILAPIFGILFTWDYRWRDPKKKVSPLFCFFIIVLTLYKKYIHTGRLIDQWIIIFIQIFRKDVVYKIFCWHEVLRFPIQKIVWILNWIGLNIHCLQIAFPLPSFVWRRTTLPNLQQCGRNRGGPSYL